MPSLAFRERCADHHEWRLAYIIGRGPLLARWTLMKLHLSTFASCQRVAWAAGATWAARVPAPCSMRHAPCSMLPSMVFRRFARSWFRFRLRFSRIGAPGTQLQPSTMTSVVPTDAALCLVLHEEAPVLTSGFLLCLSRAYPSSSNHTGPFARGGGGGVGTSVGPKQATVCEIQIVVCLAVARSFGTRSTEGDDAACPLAQLIDSKHRAELGGNVLV